MCSGPRGDLRAGGGGRQWDLWTSLQGGSARPSPLRVALPIQSPIASGKKHEFTAQTCLSMTIIAFLCRDNLPAFNRPGSAPPTHPTPPHPAQDVQPNIFSISTLAMRLKYPDRSQLIHTPSDFSRCIEQRTLRIHGTGLLRQARGVVIMCQVDVADTPRK